jgi:GIY-YIG catalytic domain
LPARWRRAIVQACRWRRRRRRERGVGARRKRHRHVLTVGPPRFFRFTLAARLIDALALRRFMRRTKVALDAADNARLSEWQREHLLLTWCPIERAWKLEREVIAELRPPLNSAGNAAHAFYPRVHDARAEFRRRAATRAAGARGASPLALNRPFSGGVSFSRSGRKPKPPGRS